jgi:hypothetical protein
MRLIVPCKYLEAKGRGARVAAKQGRSETKPASNKKRAGRKPRSKNCVDPVSPKRFGFDLD